MNDNVNGDPGGARARMAQVMKPTGKVYKGGPSHLGNGDQCPDGHGRMYALSTGVSWCPNQVHDKEKVKRDG